ncbi:hypothetical protein [Spirosoma spitsbergense]|uniref:hypothetical protein n=1 Tax=Spirosoma spitsbergense TaxID=431554 RepID=UPI0003690A50|nr:hypothetical protein [Spirosoma spitsbergense]
MPHKSFVIRVLPSLATLITLSVFSSCASPNAFSKKGIVQQIEPGKDGYTASLREPGGSDFDALVSRGRMQQAYRLVKVGDKITVEGDTIHLNQRVLVLVEKIK